MAARAVSIWLATASLAAAQAGLTRSEALIPTRDGVKLRVVLFSPKAGGEKLPIILVRTPYGVDGAGANLTSYLADLVAQGYHFAFQDIRGRFKSEGTFVMTRPPRDRSDPKSIDESTDTWDTIDWLLKNVPDNNGRVGMLGVSYAGWLSAMPLLEPHPALKAVSPQASPTDMYLGDDFHHNGAFRLSYGFEYVAMMESDRTKNFDFKFDKRDTYEWYLELGPLSRADARHFKGKMPTWNDFARHPNYDEFWRRRAFETHVAAAPVPTLTVAGWWDQEDFRGPQSMYRALEARDTSKHNHVVVGPWNHGGWARGAGDRLGRIAFGSATAKHFREKIQAPWFALYLKDKGKRDFPEAVMFQTGTNVWKNYDKWPPAGTVDRKLYFRADGKLSFDPPPVAGGDHYDEYVSDPAKPVPYRSRPIPPTYQGQGWSTWLVDDQRHADGRPDVLSWRSEPLTENLVLAGDVVADLFASTTGTDADWIVKLIDLYPENPPEDATLGGHQLMVANEVFRGRFRGGFDKPAALVPDKPTEFRFGLHWSHHAFRKGHRIMAQVQSTWFPLIDRNPQTFVENIFQAKPEDFKPARHRVHRTPGLPSHVVLPVLKSAD